MDAIQKINACITQDTIISLLEHMGFQSVHPFGNDVRAECLVHGGRNSSSFVFRSDVKLWYCHACGKYGDIVQLFREIYHISVDKACSQIAQQLGINIEGLDIKAYVSPVKKDIEKWFKFTKSTRKNTEVELYDMPQTNMKKVKRFRNFTEETLNRFGLYYVKNFPIVSRKGDKLEVHERLLTPIWFNKQMVGVNLRRINKEEKIKWLIQPTNLDKDNILYNLETGIFYDEIIVTEGIWDVWSFTEVGVESVVCLFGTTITDGQFRLLEQHTCNLVFALDGDDAGVRSTIKNIEKTKHAFNIEVVNFNPTDDPESIDRQQLRNLYDNRLHYMSWLSQHEKEYVEWKNKSKR